MKFAKQLGLRSIPSWAPYYLDYKSLKGYIKTAFKDFAGPLESLESLDHEDHEQGDTDQNVEPSILSKASPESVAAATDDDSESSADSQENHHHVTLTTSQEENELLVKETVSSTSSNKKTDEEEAAREASINIIVEGFRALLWAELEKVNARYEAQERIAGVTMDRLNASWRGNFTPAELKQWRSDLTVLILNLEYLLEFSQTNITGFKKIIKKFDKHYRGCHPSSHTSISGSTIHLPDQHHQQQQLLGADHNGSGHPNSSSGSPRSNNNAITYHGTPPDPETAGPLSMFNALGIHGRSTPTIYLPHNYPEPTSSLHPQEPFIRNVHSPGTHSKSVFYHNYYEGVSALSLEFWKMVTERTFAKSEKDERLLAEARTLWRKRTPVVAERLSPLPLSVDPKDYPVWDDLDLDILPSGRISRLWVVLAEDAMSTPIRVPVIVAKGVRPGPVVGLTAALHGNELNGIPLTHRLVLQEIQCQALHGIVVAVPVANVPGYLAQQRGFTDGTDLNRLMPGKKNGTTSQVYSYNLMTRLVKHFTHLIDLHTASKGRVNSLYVRANMQNPTTRHMARLQNPQIIVHNTSPDGSLRGAAMQQYNIPAITVEIGDPARFQKRFVKSAILGVTNILSHLKMVEDEHEVQDYDPVVCAKSYWIFTKGGGILNVLPDVNTWVRKGELIATLHNIFGQEEHRYFAPEDGIVVGKSVDPVCQSGCRILHLGVVSDHFPEGKIDDGHM
ncbi:hypothetical protein EC957_005173 [Mortierella hygrophila]|uniref:SPX domain-containing protein n=1 Tax=Mortierella hygrophila TaxID=979708 RepID=A0A9P6EZM7_9FUNG|nr:hypothetical protein EC957_005173 [Mortierella hygrophila]